MSRLLTGTWCLVTLCNAELDGASQQKLRHTAGGNLQDIESLPKGFNLENSMQLKGEGTCTDTESFL